MESSGVVVAVISVAGTLGAAAAGWALNQRSVQKLDKERQTLDLVKIYQRSFSDYSHALGYLKEWNAKGKVPDPHGINTILRIGNWFEIFATLIVRKRVDSQLVEDMGLKSQIREYWYEVTKTQAVRDKLDPSTNWKKMRQLWED